MAHEGPQTKIGGLTAGADLTAKQYYFVKLSADMTVTVCNGATDIPIGVLQNAPDSGEAAEVCAIGVTKVSSDADLDAGHVIGTSADGQADVKVAGTDTTQYAVGIVLQGSTAAGGLATALINCGSPGRAA